MEGSGAGGAVVGKVGVVFKGECHFEISPAVVIVMMAARRLSPRFAVFGNNYSSGPGNPDGGFGEMVPRESLTSRIIHCERRLRDPPSLRGRERRSEQHRLTHEHKAASPTKQVQKVVIAKSDVIAWAPAGARNTVTRQRAWRDARPQPPIRP